MTEPEGVLEDNRDSNASPTYRIHFFERERKAFLLLSVEQPTSKNDSSSSNNRRKKSLI